MRKGRRRWRRRSFLWQCWLVCLHWGNLLPRTTFETLIHLIQSDINCHKKTPPKQNPLLYPLPAGSHKQNFSSIPFSSPHHQLPVTSIQKSTAARTSTFRTSFAQIWKGNVMLNSWDASRASPLRDVHRRHFFFLMLSCLLVPPRSGGG